MQQKTEETRDDVTFAVFKKLAEVGVDVSKNFKGNSCNVFNEDEAYRQIRVRALVWRLMAHFNGALKRLAD